MVWLAGMGAIQFVGQHFVVVIICQLFMFMIIFSVMKLPQKAGFMVPSQETRGVNCETDSPPLTAGGTMGHLSPRNRRAQEEWKMSF